MAFTTWVRQQKRLKFYEHARDIVSLLKTDGPNRIPVTKAKYKAMLSLSTAESGIGKREQAARDLAEALSECQQLSVAEPNDAHVRVELANLEQRFGQTLVEARRAQEAVPHMARSAELLAKLAAADPGNAIYRRSQSVVEMQWAAALRGAGQFPAAIEHNRQALTIAEALSLNAPKNVQFRADVGTGERKLSESLLAADDSKGSLEHADRSQAIFCAPETGSDSFTRANCGRALVSKGNALVRLNRFPLALEAYRTAEQTAGEVSKADPVNAIFRSDLARAQAAMAFALARTGDPKAAAGMYRASLANWSVLRKANSLTAEDAHRFVEAEQQLAGLSPRPYRSLRVRTAGLRLTGHDSLRNNLGFGRRSVPGSG